MYVELFIFQSFCCFVGRKPPCCLVREVRGGFGRVMHCVFNKCPKGVYDLLEYFFGGLSFISCLVIGLKGHW